MKIIMYGTEICPDCVEAKAKLETCSNLELDYRNITKSTKTLKEFLYHRDHDEMFAAVIKEGRIGIPFFVLEDGTKTFDVFDFVDIEPPIPTADSCSIDKKGQC